MKSAVKSNADAPKRYVAAHYVLTADEHRELVAHGRQFFTAKGTPLIFPKDVSTALRNEGEVRSWL